LIAIHASQPFEWNPSGGVASGGKRKADSEFRIRGEQVTLALETALPADFDHPTPEAQLNAFRDTVRASSKITQRTFNDHHGHRIERTFDGDTHINGERIAYDTWPLLENPWMRQEWNGNLTLKDGPTTRVYDVTQWRIQETSRP
jgi:hypothetical protein